MDVTDLREPRTEAADSNGPDRHEVLERLEDALRVIGRARRAATRWNDKDFDLAGSDYFGEVVDPLADLLRETDPEAMKADLLEDYKEMLKEERESAGWKRQPDGSWRGGTGESHLKQMPVYATRRQLIATAAEIVEAANLLYRPLIDRLSFGSPLHDRLSEIKRELERIVVEIAVLLVEEEDTDLRDYAKGGARDPRHVIQFGEVEAEVWGLGEGSEPRAEITDAEAVPG